MRLGIIVLALLVPALAEGAPEPLPPLKPIKVLDGHDTRTRALAFDAGGTILVSGGSDRRLRVWDAKTLRLRATWRAPVRDRYEP